MSDRQLRLRNRQQKRNEERYQAPSYNKAVAKKRKILQQTSRTRHDMERLDELEKEIKQRRISLPPTPPVVLKERASRHKQPSCLYFGEEADFHKNFPDFFFCSECRAWEEHCKNPISSKCRRNSRAFRCSGKHQSWIYPTSMKPIHSSLVADIMSKEIEEGHQTEQEDVHEYMGDNENRECHTNENIMIRLGRRRTEPLCEIIEREKESDTNETYQHQHQQQELQLKQIEIHALKMEVSKLKEENKLLERKVATTRQRNYRLNLQQRDTVASLTHHFDARNAGSTTINVDASNPCTASRTTRATTTSNKNVKTSDSQHELTLNELRLLCLDMEKVVSNSRQSKKKHKEITQLLCDFFFSNDFMNGSFKTQCQSRYRRYLKQEVFPPWKILRAMDLAGGGLCLTGLEILRGCETGGKKYYRNSIVPCAAEMKRTAALVEAHSEKLGLKFIHDNLANGTEYLEVQDVQTALKFILKAYQLDDVSKHRSVSLSAAIDGAQLSKRQTHTTMGVKVNDKQAICPITNKPIFASGASSKSLVQSRNCCFPFKIILSPETKDLYQHFETMFTSFNNEYNPELTNNGSVSSLLGDQHKPIKMNVNCDLCAQWKGLKKGGAMKQKKKACTCCAIYSEDVAKPNLTRCSRWCREYEMKFPEQTGEDLRCFHKDILTDEKLAEMQNEVDELESIMVEIANQMDRIQKQSEIRVDENPHVEPPPMSDSRESFKSIWYDVDSGERRDMSQVQEYSRRVTRDLVRRGLEATGTVRQRQQRLKESLRHEYKLCELRTNLSHGKLGSEDALFILMNTLTCILHLENRVGLKIFTRILEIGLENVIDEVTYSSDSEQYQGMPLAQRISCFLDDVNLACNTVILGSPTNPAQFNCPYDRQKKVIDTITLDNNRTRLMVGNIEPILEICFADEGKIGSWSSCIYEYNKGLEILRSRNNLSGDEIFQFERHIDLWFADWIDLSGGRTGITNYIHMLASGHIADYLFHWRNLWVYSQQGWEALNAMIKTFFLRRTGRGGSAGPRGDKSRLKPIGRWFQRRMLWMTGYTINDF